MPNLYDDRATRNTYRRGLTYPNGYSLDHLHRRAGRLLP